MSGLDDRQQREQSESEGRKEGTGKPEMMLAKYSNVVSRSQWDCQPSLSVILCCRNMHLYVLYVRVAALIQDQYWVKRRFRSRHHYDG